MIYTGGTTGMPKGVMWRQDDLIRATCSTGNALLGEPCEDAGGAKAAIAALGGPGVPGLPACPLMHGTGWFTANIYLSMGGSVVCLQSHHLDTEELLDTIEREGVGALTIVGDAFAKPIVAALEANPGRWDLSSLVLMTSSGVMWSEKTQEGAARPPPDDDAHRLVLLFGGRRDWVSRSLRATPQRRRPTSRSARALRSSVTTATPVEPGSGVRGRVAVPGHVPIGYYKDPEKSAATFITHDGVRYSMPGDYATIEADGSITLLGRGSVCINTGGEKVFPEEVEEALKLQRSGRGRRRGRRARREVR